MYYREILSESVNTMKIHLGAPDFFMLSCQFLEGLHRVCIVRAMFRVVLSLRNLKKFKVRTP